MACTTCFSSARLCALMIGTQAIQNQIGDVLIL